MIEPRVPSDRTPAASHGVSRESQPQPPDPRRDDELQAVEAEVAARLRTRGVLLTGSETPEQLVDLLDAVEQFDAAVDARGGDLFVDTPATARSSARVPQPDDPAYVLPARREHEPVASYLARIREAIGRLH